MTEVGVVQSGDYAEVARFLSGFPGDAHGPAYWERRLRFWWDDNPAFAGDVPRGWTLRDGSGKVGGFLGNVPTLFRTAGRDVRVFNATSWWVLPEHRSKSIHLYLAQIEAARESFAFNTTASKSVEKVLEYLRFTSLPSTRSGRAYLVPLAAKAVARAYLRDHRLPAAARALAGAPLWGASLPIVVKMRLRDARNVRVVHRAGAEFDDLWARTKDRYAHTSVRTAARLEWTCFANPDFRKTLFAYEERGVLRGYAMFADARWRDLKVLEALDLWTDGDDGIAAPLAAAAWRHGCATGRELLVLRDYSDAITATYRQMWLFFTMNEVRRHYFGCGDRPVPDITPGNSYLSGLEGDLTI